MGAPSVVPRRRARYGTPDGHRTVAALCLGVYFALQRHLHWRLPIGLPELDPVLHAPARLRIVTALVYGGDGPHGFAALQDRLDLTAGNLSTHLRKLEDAGYLAVDKVFRDRVPSTEVALTPLGREAHRAYVEAMRAHLDGTALTETATSDGAEGRR